MTYPQFTTDELASETWKPVVGFENIYSVSDFGRVRRDAPNKFGPKTNFVHLLKPKLAGNKKYSRYHQVVLCKNGTVSYTYIHNIVTAAFIGQKPEGQEVNHIDGEKTNNRLFNLEYLPPRLNKIHCIEVLGKNRGEGKGASVKLTDGEVSNMRNLYREGMGTGEIHELYPRVSHAAVIFAITGRNWKHLPGAILLRNR